MQIARRSLFVKTSRSRSFTINIYEIQIPCIEIFIQFFLLLLFFPGYSNAEDVAYRFPFILGKI